MWIPGESLLGRGNGLQEGSEAQASLICLRNTKGISVTEAKRKVESSRRWSVTGNFVSTGLGHTVSDIC